MNLSCPHLSHFRLQICTSALRSPIIPSLWTTSSLASLSSQHATQISRDIKDRSESCTAIPHALIYSIPFSATLATFSGNGECLTLGLHRGCSNVWNQVSSPRKRIRYAKRCENKHLPVVQMVGSTEAATTTPSSPTPILKSGESLLSADRTIADKRINHLKCSDDVTGFIACSMIQTLESSRLTTPGPRFQASSFSQNRASSSSSSSASSEGDCDPLQTNGSPWKCIPSRSATSEDEE